MTDKTPPFFIVALVIITLYAMYKSYDAHSKMSQCALYSAEKSTKDY